MAPNLVMNSWWDTEKHLQKKKKIDELDYIKMKTFMYRRILSMVERQPTEWEKILADHVSDIW